MSLSRPFLLSLVAASAVAIGTASYLHDPSCAWGTAYDWHSAFASFAAGMAAFQGLMFALKRFPLLIDANGYLDFAAPKIALAKLARTSATAARQKFAMFMARMARFGSLPLNTGGARFAM